MKLYLSGDSFYEVKFVFPLFGMYVCNFASARNSHDSGLANRPFYNYVLSGLALIASEAVGDLVLIQTSLLFICKCKLVNVRTT